MNKCQAKVTSHSGTSKYHCLREPEYRLTITTYNKDKKQVKVKVKILCAFHAKRLRNKINYEIKHSHKNKEYIQESINKHLL